MIMIMIMIVIVMMMMIEQKTFKTYKKACDDRINVVNILKFIYLYYLLCLNNLLWKYKYLFKIKLI